MIQKGVECLYLMIGLCYMYYPYLPPNPIIYFSYSLNTPQTRNEWENKKPVTKK